MFTQSRVAILLALAFASSVASAHIRMTTPTPRSNADGLKVGPCGNVPRTANNTKYTPGQVVNVAWTETINHPGYFTFELSQANDANFVELWRFQDNQNTVGMHNFTGTITIPANVNCANCTLRLIQYMTENPNMPSLYYSCADVSIQAAVDPGDGAVTTPSQPPVVVPPEGGSNTSQGLGGPVGKPGKMAGGCGMVAAVNDRNGGPTPPQAGFVLLALLAPLMVWLRLQRLNRHDV